MAKDTKAKAKTPKTKPEAKAKAPAKAPVNPGILMYIGPNLARLGLMDGQTFKSWDRLPGPVVEALKTDQDLAGLIRPILEAGKAKAGLVEFNRTGSSVLGSKIARARAAVAKNYSRR